MADVLSIKIKIGDRDYPMKVKPEEEARVRTASKQINEKLKKYREQFKIDDKQDLLSMVAFDCLVEKLSIEEKSGQVDESANDSIARLEALMANALS